MVQYPKELQLLRIRGRRMRLGGHTLEGAGGLNIFFNAGMAQSVSADVLDT